MKVAVFRRRFVAHGGGERFVDEFLRRLAAAGHEPHLFCEAWPPGARGVAMHRVPVPGRGSALPTLGYAWLAPRLARAAGLDVVLSFERTLDQDVFRAGEGCHRQWLALRRRHLHGPPGALASWRPFHRVVLAIERRIARGAARVVAVNSRLVEAGFRRHYPSGSPRLVLVRNGVDVQRHAPAVRAALRPAARERLGLAAGDLALLLVGSGFERKGVPAAAAALGRLAARGIQAVLLVAGRGRAADVRRAAGRAGTGRLRLLGVVDDLRPLYAAADVFVLPSVYDPASNATLEAMAMGLPVVTSATNGSSELIDPGRSGWVLGDAGNAEVLAGMLEEAADPARRRAVGEAGRRAVEPWTWERHLDAMLALCTPGG